MSVGAVTALTVLLAAPAVHGMLVGARTPFDAAVRLLAALLVAMAAEALLRRLLPPVASSSGGASAGGAAAGGAAGAAGVPRQRSASPAVVPQPLPEVLAERLRAEDGTVR